MRQDDLDWKPTRKHISEYKVTRLPRGDEESHTTFTPIKFQKPAPQRGPKRKSDEDVLKEQVENYKKKEAKLEVGALGEE